MALSKHVLLIHGWSAESQSMEEVAGFLRDRGFNTVPLSLADYPSLYDDVRVEDVARRMDIVIGELQERGKLGPKFHIVVHSTGTYIAREWIADRFEKGQRVPVENFLMLAPANHGSPLAIYGRSALGRITKFNLRRGFQSGEELLHALELGSEYQERLDLRDRLSKGGNTESPYAPGKVWPYVIVGAQPIDGTTILNQNGWDGTVRIAGANFDPRGVTVDFTQDRLQPRITGWSVRGVEKTAFAVLPDHNHSSILYPVDKKKKHRLTNDDSVFEVLGNLIVEALTTASAGAYNSLVERWDGITAETHALSEDTEKAADERRRILRKPGDRERERYNQFYQIVVNVLDDTPRPVSDYFVWLTAPTQRELDRGLVLSRRITLAERTAHRDVLRSVHVNRRQSSRRTFHLDRNELMEKFYGGLTQARDPYLMAALTANADGSMISFFEKDTKRGTGYIPLRAENPEGEYNHSDRFLKHYATHYVEVIIPRVPQDEVFRVRSYGR